LTMAEVLPIESTARIRELTIAGARQSEIAVQLGIHRNSVFRWQRAMGLTSRRHGPRAPRLTASQERAVLRRLQRGHGTKRIADSLGLREWAVRTFARKHRFEHPAGTPGHRYRLDGATRAKIVDEILNRRNYARDIAGKFGVSYKIVLRLAHETLACPRFRSGRAEPLSSNWPMRERRRG